MGLHWSGRQPQSYDLPCCMTPWSFQCSLANFLLYMSINTKQIESDRLTGQNVLTTNGTGMLQAHWVKWLSLNWKTVWWFVWYGFPQCTQGFWGDWRLTQDVKMGGSKTPTIWHYWQEVPYYMAWGTTWDRAEMRGLSCHNHQTEHYRLMNPAECWWNETLQKYENEGAGAPNQAFDAW